MDSDRLARWLTLIANIGVLIGIILLIVELDQNRDMMRSQTRNDISQGIADFLSMGAVDAQVASLWWRAEAGEKLTPDEDKQYSLILGANLRLWENIHYQYRHGMFDESEFDSERVTWQLLINNNKYFPAAWCRMRTFYSTEFSSEIDQLLENNPCTSSSAE